MNRWVVVGLLIGLALAGSIYGEESVSPRRLQAYIDDAGAVLELAEGVYEGPGVISAPMTVRAAPDASVILQGCPSDGPVLTVVAEGEVVLENLQIQHTPLDEAPDEAAVVKVEAGEVRLDGCTVQNGAELGIWFEGGRTLTMRNCVVQDNTGTGVYVSGDSVEAHIHDTTFASNGRHGLSLGGEGLVAHVADSVMRENGMAGLLIWQGKSLEAARVETIENGDAGFLSQHVADTVSLLHCTSSNNGGVGIYIREGVENLTIGHTTANGNQYAGMVVEDRATGAIEDSTAHENGIYGLSLWGEAVRVDLRRNEAHRNQSHGINVGNGAFGAIEDNVCNENNGHGIAFSTHGHHLIYTRNRTVGNASSGAGIGRRIRVRYQGSETLDMISFDNGAYSPTDIAMLLATHRFHVLEEHAAWLRANRVRYPSGTWRLNDFYFSITRMCGWGFCTHTENYPRLLEEWVAAYPESVTARIALADAHVNLAWEARGGGVAHTVTPEGWETFYHHLEIAREHLETARGFEDKDPHLYATYIPVAMGLGRRIEGERSLGQLMTEAIIGQSLGLSRPTFAEQIFMEGVDVEPAYHRLYTTRATALLPRWGGSNQAVRDLIEFAVDRTRTEYNDGMYAIVPSGIQALFDTGEMEQQLNLCWDRLESAVSDIIERSETPYYWLNHWAYIACRNENREVAKTAFDKIGDRTWLSVWSDERDMFEAAKRWANGEGPLPSFRVTDYWDDYDGT